MGKKNKAVASTFKKDIQKQLEDHLSTVVASLHPQIGEKKLRKRLHRAGKILTKGIKPVKENKVPAENETA